MLCFFTWLIYLSHYYHVLGTDRGGADVAYQSLKGIRTGVLLGTLSTLIMLVTVILVVLTERFTRRQEKTV